MFRPKNGPQQRRRIFLKLHRAVTCDPLFEGGSRDNDIVVPVMGPTGAGKSTFINQVCGREVVQVGHVLASHTELLQAIVLPHDLVSKHIPLWPADKRLILVDTPGFDDTKTSDVDILNRVAIWLALSYCKDMKLGGVIYLQSINITRMTGTAFRNLHVFEDLCGKNAFSSILLGTTQWGLVRDEHISSMEDRHDDLVHSYWKHMHAHGSSVWTVDKGHSSSHWDMITTVTSRLASQVLLTIQDELVNLEKEVPETKAGQRLREDLQRCLAALHRSQDIEDREHRARLRNQVLELKIPVSARFRAFIGI